MAESLKYVYVPNFPQDYNLNDYFQFLSFFKKD